MEPYQQYTARIQQAEAQLHQVKVQIQRISTLRVLLFLAGVIGVIYFYSEGGFVVCLIAALTFVPFLALVKYHNRLYYRKSWLEMCIRIHQEELAALQHNYETLPNGSEFIDPSHRYAFDLDLFGPHSLFQALNRTCTSFGKEELATWLQQHLTSKEDIEQRQIAVQELSPNFDFREAFRITGLLSNNKDNDRQEIKRWCESPAFFYGKKWVRFVLWAVPATNLLIVLLGLTGVLSFSWIGISMGMYVVASLGFVRSVSHLQSSYDKNLRILSTYSELIEKVEKLDVQSKLLKGLQAEFRSEGKPATDILNGLSRHLNRLDLRNNQILYILLEGSLFWQLRQVTHIEAWKQQYGKYLLHWLHTLGKVDALCSLATFAYNHPTYRYPTLVDTPFVFKASEMRHPLMPAQQCVPNDADIPAEPFFIIITGANMAGKSTYLRTIGVNYLLACIGSVTASASLEIYPAQLMTSLRTSDSLTDHESYFFAELKRLKQMIDRLNQGEKLFIILDEILKGTNSMDKQKGSFALIQQLMALRANGIIATHDLQLGQLAERFPTEIRNYCFEADIENNELHFSYQLREGVAQNMNACFLMKKMGLIIND